MPHLVEMHKQFGPQGFVAVSVALDRRDPTVEERILKILKKQNMTVINLYLDEPEEFWTKKLGFEGVPAIYVFNREGKYRRHLSDMIDDGYGNIRKLVDDWVQKK
jgi:hypothetical protein